jgi:hypothetical protein
MSEPCSHALISSSDGQSSTSVISVVYASLLPPSLPPVFVSNPISSEGGEDDLAVRRRILSEVRGGSCNDARMRRGEDVGR